MPGPIEAHSRLVTLLAVFGISIGIVGGVCTVASNAIDSAEVQAQLDAFAEAHAEVSKRADDNAVNTNRDMHKHIHALEHRVQDLEWRQFSINKSDDWRPTIYGSHSYGFYYKAGWSDWDADGDIDYVITEQP